MLKLKTACLRIAGETCRVEGRCWLIKNAKKMLRMTAKFHRNIPNCLGEKRVDFFRTIHDGSKIFKCQL